MTCYFAFRMQKQHNILPSTKDKTWKKNNTELSIFPLSIVKEKKNKFM